MKRLRNKNTTPPGGWRYVDPDTGFRYRGYRSLEELLAHVRKYRHHNNLSVIPSLQLVVEDWLCNQPGMEVYCQGAGAVSRTLRQYLRGARAAAKTIVRGEKAFESQRIAEARAALCVNCKHNRPIKKHSKLERYTDKYAISMVGPRRTSFDDKLYTCNLCTCPLRPKVHIAQDIIEEELTSKDRRNLGPAIMGLDGKEFHCWQIKPVELGG